MSSAAWPVHIDPSHLYFITTRAVKGAHIFRRDIIKRILVDCLNVGRILGQYELFAYVLMPNHIHFLVRCLHDYTAIDVVREYKKAAANLIIRQLELENNDEALAFLAHAAPPQQTYQVWEHEYSARNVYSIDFLKQKLNYIHNNPRQPHWRLVEKAEAYIWSSARFYLADGRSLIPLSDARKLM